METPTNTMRAMKGDDYINAWPAGIAAKHQIHVSFVARSINNVLGTSIPDGAFAGTLHDPDAIKIVANLTPDDVKAITPHLQGYARQVEEARRNSCHFCGQDTGGRPCRECI